MDHIDRMRAIKERKLLRRAAKRKKREDRGIKLPLKPRNWRKRRKKRRQMAKRSRRINARKA